MPRVVHIVTTAAFAGVERYVCTVASVTAGRGWEVTVVGGDRERMAAALNGSVRWLPGSTLLEALRSIRDVGRCELCHAHMTAAEAVAVATRPIHRAPIVSTRHFAARRGASILGRAFAPWLASSIASEIAVGEFVAQSIERAPASVIVTGVPESPCLWRPTSRTVLVLQRLEAEKDTMTALRAWKASRLADDGWSLNVFGDGSERGRLEHWVAAERVGGITFGGWTNDARAQLSRAGMLLAPAPAEPFGLSVLDAMAAGVPVVASAAGGHLETVGLLDDAALFPPGDAAAAAARLRSLLSESARERLSTAGRRTVAERFSLEDCVDRLLAEYELAMSRPRGRRRAAIVRRAT